MRIWVSLTTTPGRIAKMERTIQSLLLQKYSAEKIVLNLPQQFGRDGSSYVIPEWLEKLIYSNLVVLNRTERDYGAITKLFPTLALIPYEEDVWIATADDDIDYLPHQLELYARMSEVFTQRPAMALSGCFLRTDGTKLVIEPSKKTEGVDIIEGYSLPIYHRSFFQPSFDAYVEKCLTKYELKNSDDIVISNWLRLNKIQALQVGVVWCSRNRLWGENRVLVYGNEADALHIMDDNQIKYQKALKWLEENGICGFTKERKTYKVSTN
jgi:hypothetical protein